MAASLSARHWIGGTWVDSATRLVSIDPATGETIGTYAEAGEAEAKQAIKVARQAFLETDWRGNRRLRAKAINEMADRFEARTDDLVAILSLENGKIEPEARFEVSMVPSKLRFYAALALTEFGRAIETAPGRYSTTLREPVGVAGIIAPWNSPAASRRWMTSWSTEPLFTRSRFERCEQPSSRMATLDQKIGPAKYPRHGIISFFS